jgi:hypothetical protein
MATITLRIVGLYFSKDVEVDLTTRPTIKAILDDYITKFPISVPGGLEYDVNPAANAPGGFTPGSLKRMSHNFDGSYLPSKDNPNGLSLLGIKRQAGIYSLEEIEVVAGGVEYYLSWQYYVTDTQTGVLLSKTKPGAGFATFDTFVVCKPCTITFRLLVIPSGPSIPAESSATA